MSFISPQAIFCFKTPIFNIMFEIKLPIIVKFGPKPNPSYNVCVLTMKADESADCAGSCGRFFRNGLCIFFLGPRNRKANFLKTRISAGSRFSHPEHYMGDSIQTKAAAWVKTLGY
jgi:hypothetical protein